jgi:catechol 2,3-dioxygenase-like lactoylglutathione lyase family enzyme
VTKLHHASITTKNLDRLREFYCSQFGFVEVLASEWAGDNPTADAIFGLPGSAVRMVMLRADNAFLELFEFAHPQGRAGDPLRPVCDAGYTHICIAVDDIDADYARLTAAGMTFNCPPQNARGLGRATYGRDPDGNLVELIQLDPAGPFAMPT